MIQEIFRRTVVTHGLLTAGDRILVAVSGGGDSVALLRLLAGYRDAGPLTLVVAHVNHRLRGAASDGDQTFVEDLAAGLGLECVTLQADAPAREPGAPMPGEESLRRARHLLLGGAARDRGCDRIALAHTMDDQAETILMRLVRGSGRRGLSGMAFRGPGRLIRPMLEIRREMVRAWLDRIGQPRREDETNADPRYLRNRVRARLLPAVEEMNPRAVEAMARAAGILALEDRYLDRLARGWLGGRSTGVSAGELASLPRALAMRVARLMLKRAGGEVRGARLADVTALLDLAGRGRDGDSRCLGGGIEASRDGVSIVLKVAGAEPAREAGPYSRSMPVPGRVELPDGGGVLEARLVPREAVAADPADEAPGPGRLALLDARRLGPVVTVRNRRPGDLFHPLGAPGSRRLKEFLIDRKVPRRQRDIVPLVVGPVGIAWVVGERVAHPYRLTEATELVARLEYTPRVDLPDSKRII